MAVKKSDFYNKNDEIKRVFFCVSGLKRLFVRNYWAEFDEIWQQDQRLDPIDCIKGSKPLL